MKRSIQTTIALLSASLLVLTALAIGRGQAHTDRRELYGHSGEPSPVWHASWQFHPKTLVEANTLSAAVVHVRVVEIRQADPLVHITPASPDGTKPERRVETPTQRITLDVVQSLRGTPGGTVRLWHMGTDTIHLEGDPPYEVGQDYVLFVYPKEDEAGTYLVLSPEGRYRITGGRLDPASDAQDTFAPGLRGHTVADLAQQLQALP